MMNISIRFVDNDVIAFEITNEVWYLKTSGYPSVYDSRLIKQNFANVDSWLQSKTGHRYSYRTVCDMAEAFASGLRCSYDARDLIRIGDRICRTTASEIFQTKLVGEYRKIFWIESLDPSEIAEKSDQLRSNFDAIRDSIGDEELYNQLRRLWRFCFLRDLNATAVFEKLILRLGKTVRDPEFPDTTDFDDDLCDRVMAKNIRKDIPLFLNIPQEIMENVDAIRTGRV